MIKKILLVSPECVCAESVKGVVRKEQVTEVIFAGDGHKYNFKLMRGEEVYVGKRNGVWIFVATPKEFMLLDYDTKADEPETIRVYELVPIE